MINGEQEMIKDDLIQGLSDDVIELSKKELIMKEKILEAKQKIFARFDKESTYRELCEDTARGIVAHALDSLINELDREEDVTNENRTSRNQT
tara:strand:+ start:552 stop:830 length:279 start_codon:yes stop_codon:yes gene_type:complete